MHVRDARAGVRRHGEAARGHVGDDFIEREEPTARTPHQVPGHTGQSQPGRDLISVSGAQLVNREPGGKFRVLLRTVTKTGSCF